MLNFSVFLKKSEESLNAAICCFEKGWYNSCVNRAYYAMFQVALSALLKSGISPKSKKIGHGWVQAEFVTFFILRNKKFPQLKNFLNWVQEWRNTADYSDEELSEKKAKRVLDRTAVFVEQVSREVKNGS
jgi:uncharacterized protein (UPF0332 family)